MAGLNEGSLVVKVSEDFVKACKDLDLGTIKALLKDGANVSYTDKSGWSGLHWACIHGDVHLVQLLLDAGAGKPYRASKSEMNGGEGKLGMSSVGGAGQNEQKQGDQEQKGEAGASAASVTGVAGSTVASSSSSSSRYVQRNFHKDIVNSPIHWACFKGHLEIVWLLLQHGLSPYTVDECGNNALHLAVSGGHAEVAKVIMAQGFDLERKNYYGNTAVGIAATEEVKKLVQSAARALACNSSGQQFSSTVWRYRCTCSGHFFAASEVVHEHVLAQVGGKLTKPVCYGKVYKKKIEEAEVKLQESVRGELGKEHIETLRQAVQTAKDLGCNVLFVRNGERKLTRLQAQCALRDAMDEVTALRPIKERKQYGILMKRLDEAKVESATGVVAGVDEGDALLQAVISEVEIVASVEACASIECANDSHRPDMDRLETAVDNGKLAAADPGLLESSEARLSCLQAEVEIASAMEEPMQNAVVDEEGEPVDAATRYTLSDGSEFNSTVPGEKLACWQKRSKRLTDALEDGEKYGAFGELIEKGKAYLETLDDDLQELEKEEKERLDAEEDAKNKKKGKKKKGKKKK